MLGLAVHIIIAGGSATDSTAAYALHPDRRRGFLLTLSDTGFASYKKFHVLSKWFAVGLTAICNGIRVLRHS